MSARLTAGTLLLLAAGGRFAFAQEILFEQLSTEQGLSSVAVEAVLKDRHGFVWFGTRGGLDRFDGQRVVNYTPPVRPDGTSHSAAVQVLYEDKKGQLWIGLVAGLQRLDRERDRLEPVPLPDGFGAVTGISGDAGGRLWLAGSQGLASLDPTTGVSRQHLSGKGGLQSVLVDRRGQIWLAGTSGDVKGLSRFDPATGAVTRVSLDESDTTDTPNDAYALCEDPGGRIWVGGGRGERGLASIDPTSGHVTRYLPDPSRPGSIGTRRVLAVTADQRGRLYLGTENAGLEILDTASGRFRKYAPRRGDDRSLSGASIRSLAVDDQGILWVGTYNGGVSYTSEVGSRFTLVQARREDELSDPHVSAILLDRRGTLWVGTDGGGLNRFTPGASRTGFYRHDARDPGSIGSDAILGILEDSQGRIWLVGWAAGVGLLDPATGRVTTYRHGGGSRFDSIYRAVEDGPRHLLLGGFGGLERFDRETRTFSPVTVSGGTLPIIRTLARDARGNLWLGGPGGVYRIDQATNTLVQMPFDAKDPESFGPGAGLALLLDSRGNLWVGLDGGGLRCVPAGGGAVRAWWMADGLSGNSVEDMLEDDAGHLWVSTNKGLSRLRNAAQLPEVMEIVNFDAADGLQSGEFRFGAAYKAPSGEMFFGGQRGLNRFFPSRIKPNTQPPRVHLTGLRLFNRPLQVGLEGSPLERTITQTSELVLSHDQSVVTFEFAATNYILSEKNRYRYQMEPLEKEWVEAGRQSFASYSLAPGDYLFKVKAANNDGVWSEEVTELAVRVEQPWYWSYVARGAYVFAIAAALFVGYRMRVRSMARRHRELETEVAQRTSELAASAQSLQAQSQALAEENEERRRAEEEARRAAEQSEAAKHALEENQAGLEREVSERKKAEEAAGRERDLLVALMDNIPDLIYFKDRECRFTRINRAQAAALGVATPEAALGRSDIDFFGAEFARRTMDDERRLLRSGEPMIGQLEQDAKTGCWFLASKVPLRDPAGRVTGLVGISKDITERKEAEQRLERDLDEFLAFVNQVSKGDLTRRAKEGEDVLGRIASGFNAMLASFASILLVVRDVAVSVSTSSAEILAASTQIAKGAQEGSDQVHQTSAAVEEMSASMNQVSRDADASAQAATTVLEHVHEGEVAVGEAFEGMARIDSAVGGTAEKMTLLDRRSREIFEVIGLIEEIASQSELLSLNAAIQAAHAGEAGRGFTVVADEIRRLAERSKEASRDVSRIVEGIVDEVRMALAAMRLVMDEVKTERGLSEKARASLREIEALVAKSVGLASQISLASREQARATHTASSSIQSIATITAESAAGAHETSRAVEHVVRLTDDLTQAIARFRIAENERELAQGRVLR